MVLQRPPRRLYVETPRQPLLLELAQLMGFYSRTKQAARSTQPKRIEHTSPNMSLAGNAEPCHPITAPLTPLPTGTHRALRCAGTGQANARGEGLYLISKTSWRLSSYFFFHSFASISFVII